MTPSHVNEMTTERTSYTLARNLKSVTSIWQDDNLVAFGSASNIGAAYLFDLDKKPNEQLLHTIKSPYNGQYITKIWISKKQDLLICGYSNNLIHVHQLSTGTKMHVLRGHKGKGISHLEVEYDDSIKEPLKSVNIFSVCKGSGEVIQWEAISGKMITKYDTHKHDITHLQFGYMLDKQTNGDMPVFATSCSADKTIKIWSTNGKLVKTLEGHAVTCFQFDQLGDELLDILCSGSVDGTIMIWDMQSGKAKTLKGHQGSIETLKFDGEKNILVSAGADLEIRVWDVEKGICKHVLKGHQSFIRCLTMYGKMLFSGGNDPKIFIWDLEKGDKKGTMEVHQSTVTHIQVGGGRVITGSEDGSCQVHYLS